MVDSIFFGAEVLNVFTRRFEKKDIYVKDKKIFALLDSKEKIAAKNKIDCRGKKIVPGFIDAHNHIESSNLLPPAFAEEVLKVGTTSLIADCHEIANVLGADAVRLMIELSKGSSSDIFYMIPSCVPATEFEHSGGKITASDIEDLCKYDCVLGLGEMMNFPGVLSGDREIFAKLEAVKKARGKFAKVDGHAPLLSGLDLQKYIAAGISTDHECSSFEEVRERLESGIYVILRQGSSARDLEKIVPSLVKSGLPLSRICFCTDDKRAGDIIEEGHIDSNIRNAIKCGMNPVDAFVAGSFNAAKCYSLDDRGAIAPGRIADFVILDDEKSVAINSVVKNGAIVDRGRAATEFSYNVEEPIMQRALHSVHLTEDEISEKDFTSLSAAAKKFAIKIIPGSLNTKKVPVSDEPREDTCYLSVIERHQRTGNKALCILSGYGIKKGAIAMSHGHDSHNIIVAGQSPIDMAVAVKKIIQMQGGIAVCEGQKITASLELPVAGLMSLKGSAHVTAAHKELLEAARNLGIPEDVEPFVTLSFMSLPVIPEIRLTDAGLFDVGNFSFL